ncbi:MAG: hypothetical protein IKU01_01780 [Bacteroidales bacterium]|nr:hypothetical protein [Bacteroidales bacterium]
MANSTKQARDNVRSQFMLIVGNFLEERGEEVLLVGSNEYAVPVVRNDGEEDFLVLTFKMPTGSRDGDPYDGYAMAEDYALKLKAKAEKAKAAAEAKAKKQERDRKMREAKAEAKAKREG